MPVGLTWFYVMQMITTRQMRHACSCVVYDVHVSSGGLRSRVDVALCARGLFWVLKAVRMSAGGEEISTSCLLVVILEARRLPCALL